MRGARAQISIAAFVHNVGKVREWAPHSQILAMVKADAYGHGLPTMAPYLESMEDIAGLGVARLHEALCVRQACVQKPIFLMEGFGYADELESIDHKRLVVVVHHMEQIQAMARVQVKSPIPVWIKVNTGMNRLGFPGPAVQGAYQALLRIPDGVRMAGMMTHFAKADEPVDPMTQMQMARFYRILQETGLAGNVPISMANSAAIVALPETHGDWVRPGIVLYGVSPFYGTRGFEWGLRPVMSFETDLIAVYAIQAGETVGYGGQFTADRPMRLGIAAAGYGDGYPVVAPSGTPVWVGGKRCPLVGRVSMDMLAVDLSEVPHAAVGDRVVLWGEELPMEEVAEAIGVIPWSLCCGVTQRVHRIVDAPAALSDGALANPPHRHATFPI